MYHPHLKTTTSKARTPNAKLSSLLFHRTTTEVFSHTLSFFLKQLHHADTPIIPRHSDSEPIITHDSRAHLRPKTTATEDLQDVLVLPRQGHRVRARAQGSQGADYDGVPLPVERPVLGSPASPCASCKCISFSSRFIMQFVCLSFLLVWWCCSPR